MKTINKIMLHAVFVLLFSYTIAKDLPSGDDTPIALVKKVVKDVTFKESDESDWELAKTGVPLQDGQEIKTGNKSLALILFTDGSGLLRVRENSILHIYGEKETNKLNKNTFLQKGQLGFQVSKQEDEQFKFTTPTVVASIRGTGGYIDVEDDSSTTIVCETGEIELQATGGEKQSGNLTGGNSANINSNGQININQSTDDEKNELNKNKQTETKVIKIKTENGEIEIEYLPEGN
ncbi:MAG: hypothetical protein A2068_10765 [Ignavibacteria bacterium GWB2_35_6b]|nr:MAG: hypothetical protein A2068_10765 [Ignavibacteria bacterium GWB2_35_6b]